MLRVIPLVLTVALTAACFAAGRPVSDPDRDWPVTGGDPGNSRYSPLRQIDRTNVGRLTVAWVYHTGDAALPNRSQIQATPIVIHGVLYATSPALKAFAVRADDGRELWHFDPYAGRKPENSVNRGVAWWESGSDHRILYVAGSRLYALDAATGQPIPSFGTGGWVDLTLGLGRDSSGQSVVATSPGVIYGDLLIQGTRVGEGDGSAPGHVRAYDVRTGRIRWTFHPIPQPGEPAYETWPPDAWKTVGGANAWAGMGVDVARGIVYVPTGSATPDFYGGARSGPNLYANTLLALDAATGKRIWHYQTIHHDLWDRDLPAPPNLLTVVRDGRPVDAVAQITKTGFVFLFDRTTGAPLFPVEERAVLPSDLPGEHAWPTQPFPLKPAPFARQTITEADLTILTPAAHDAVLQRYRTLRPGVLFTPPSLEGSIIFPGFDGGGEWGGAAVDRESAVLYVNGSDVPTIAAMAPDSGPTTAGGRGTISASGEGVYAAACVGCHRPDRRGDGDRIPSLVDVGSRLSPAQILEVINRGRGFMPPFYGLSEANKDAVIAYLRGGVATTSAADVKAPAGAAPTERSPFRFQGYERWRDPSGYPAVKPPWGTLNAIDLNTGDYLWKITLGEMAELTARGIPPTGTPQYGGPIVTAGGLIFIGATLDEKFRAFDKRTGKLLWETALPAAGYATPSTYSVGGRQYVVIAAGGGKLGTKSADTYVAYALPK
ncbi:MAG: hypothetical protein NVS1B4_18460 [Gemmatimonadaceae bacterium]